MSTGEGSTFGKYFLLKKLAQGGMGEIFLAKIKGPVGFEKLLVIKRVLAQHVENQEFVEMFFAEARVAAQLTHSNIVQIYEMGEIADAYFIAMEYVHGKTLREIIDRSLAQKKTIPPAYTLDIIGKLCAGLSYAHNAHDMSGRAIGIIHRDINPHNLIVSYSGEVKIIDFGIAKSELAMHKTETGTIKGKFVYMSPEQSAAEKLDKRSDLFSVGICLYEALVGINPFAKANIVLSLDAIQRKEPDPVSSINPALAIFDAIIAKALAKDRNKRYADGNDMARDLQQLMNSGQLPPAGILADYMQELFAEQIEDEKRMILETDSANTAQIQVMRQYTEKEHRTGPVRPEERAERAQAAHVAAATIQVPPSRLPFVVAVILILLLTAAGVVFVMKFLPAREPAAPPPVVAQAQPAQAPTPGASAVAAKDTDEADVRARAKNKVRRSARASDDDRPPREPSREPAREAPKQQQAVAPPPPPPPTPEPEKYEPPPEPVAASSFGNMQISTIPPVHIFLGSMRVGQTLKLNQSGGTLVFGKEGDPIIVTMKFRAQGGHITYWIEAEPWAIVRGNGGIGLGKTPLSDITGEGKDVFELLNPKEGIRQRITIRYSQ